MRSPRAPFPSTCRTRPDGWPVNASHPSSTSSRQGPPCRFVSPTPAVRPRPTCLRMGVSQRPRRRPLPSSSPCIDSMPSAANARIIMRQSGDFIHQLVQAWPPNARPLPASFRTDTGMPDVVFMSGPTQDNNYDCGVAIVVVAMYVLADARLPPKRSSSQQNQVLALFLQIIWRVGSLHK
ncbi:hypothetical protein QBC39DRAFT_385317, partial [Podospora conica]